MTIKILAGLITATLLTGSSFGAEPRFPTEDHKKYPLIEFTENGKVKAVPYIEPDFVKQAKQMRQKLLSSPIPLPEESGDVVQYYSRLTGAGWFPTGDGQPSLEAPQQRPCLKFVCASDGRVKNIYELGKDNSTKLFQSIIYDAENRFVAIGLAVRDNKPRGVNVYEVEPGAEPPSNRRTQRSVVVFVEAGDIAWYIKGSRYVDRIVPPRRTVRAASDKLPCQAKRFHAELVNTAADTSLSAVQKAAAIVALADIKPEADEEPADENFSYTALHGSVVDTLAALKITEALTALATLRDRPEIDARVREALGRSGDERFLPPLPAGWEQANLKTKQQMAYKLLNPEVKPPPQFVRAVQVLAPTFHAVECSTNNGTAKIVKLTFNELGGRMDGIRFTTPPGKVVRFDWLFAYPPDCGQGSFQWYIVPVKGTMTGFDFPGEFRGRVANVPWPANYRVLEQPLGTLLEGDTEYVIWFALHFDKPAEFYVAVNLFPNVTNGRFGLDVFGLKLAPKEP